MQRPVRVAVTAAVESVPDGLRRHQPTRDYMARRTAEGKSKNLLMRVDTHSYLWLA
ncbi:hypothetical protein MHEL_37320 [Mycolicibacterium helvum]|uniref:Uncharacterized protein n=1 Tax=Mycolicibacterium helvum TaxID=1534349 RepID=A0A7I7TAL3_9MYCO|nr:hypothetical protein MHEL_37320 [Mycolicibacterium helvum]